MRRALRATMLALIGLITPSQATPLQVITAASSSSPHARTIRCDFPGILVNHSTRNMTVSYDSDQGHITSIVKPGHNSTELVCDADFIYPKGYTLVTRNTVGPMKGDYEVEEGESFKMDAYTFDCRDGDGDGGEERKGTAIVECASTYNGNHY